MTQYDVEDLVNTGSDKELLSDGTKPLAEPMLTISEILWHSFRGNVYCNTQNMNLKSCVWNVHVWNHNHTPGHQLRPLWCQVITTFVKFCSATLLRPLLTMRCHFIKTFVKLCGARLLRPLLTHWGRVTHICVCKLTIIGSDNGLSPERRQAIIWTNAGILLIGSLGTNFSDIS